MLDLLWRSMWIALALLSMGCAGSKQRRRARPPGPIVRSVELEGVDYFEEDELLSHLNLQPTPVIALRGKHYYVPGLEQIDEGRIEDLYAAHGHFDARVTAIDVEVETKGCEKAHARRAARRERKGKPPPRPLRRVAHVRIAVDEGEPTRVRERAMAWRDYEANGATVDESAVAAEVGLEEGDVFEIPAYEGGAEDMRFRLRQSGFVDAQIHKQAELDTRARRAALRYEIDPGASVRIGEIAVEGLELVPADLVAREWEFALGKRYSPELVRRVEQSVYAMEVFSAVSVEEGEPHADGTVDLVVHVTESKLQGLKTGVALGVDPVRWEQRATLRYRHDSLFGRLTRLDAELEVGWAELPALYNPEQHGPVMGLSLTFRKKGILEDDLVWIEKPSIELGIWDGYQFWTAKNRIGVSRFFTKYFELGLSYNNKFTDFFNISPTLNENRTILGLDFRDPYVVSYLELEATVHLVDDLVNPQNGARLRTGYDIAQRYLGSQFNFHRIPIELQLFYRPHDRVRLLGRAKVGFIVPFGDPDYAGVPIDGKWYLGGAYTVRGWPLRELSPRVTGDCNDEGRKCDEIPVGGKTMVLFNVEPQVRLWKELWLGTFLDVGDNRDEVARFEPRGWQATTGGGLRYVSPIGTIRFDFGYRLSRDDARFPVEQRFLPGDENYAFHLAIGGVF